MGVPLDLWFDDLVEEVPAAEKYRGNVDRLVTMYWDEAEERARLTRTLAELQEQLNLAKARAEGVDARRRYGLELSMQMFDRGSAYTNLIMSAGYAAILTAWTTSYSSINVSMAQLIGALSLVSLFGFIAWEITKMIYIAHVNGQLAKTLMLPSEVLPEALDGWNERVSRMQIPLKRLWLASLAVTIPTGLGAGILLIFQLAWPKVLGT